MNLRHATTVYLPYNGVVIDSILGTQPINIYEGEIDLLLVGHVLSLDESVN